MNPKLFTPFKIRNLILKNRVVLSPMCTYSAINGVAQPFHLVHLGDRALGGAGLLIVEATGVSPEGRISPKCLGLWNDEQMNAMKPIVSFIKQQNAIAGIQLAHAGRKASHEIASKGGAPIPLEQGGWETVAPSSLAYSEHTPNPKELTHDSIKQVINDFIEAAKRSLEAGFEVIELHMAHGYLMHQFLSPLSNKRTDEYGGNLENRMRLPLQIAEAVREIIPEDLPLFVRISATDWADGGWDIEQSIVFCQELKKRGVDLIDCSSGGLVPYQKIFVEPNYQVPFSKAIQQDADILTGAVGLITEPDQAENILKLGNADLIFIGRELLRDPYWPLHAAKTLGATIPWPVQYERAKI